MEREIIKQCGNCQHYRRTPHLVKTGVCMLTSTATIKPAVMQPCEHYKRRGNAKIYHFPRREK